MKDNKKKQSGSVFVNLLNAFSAFLYTLISGRCGQYRGLGDKDAYHNSRTAEFLEKNVGYRSQKSTDVVERFLEKSIALRVAGAFRSFMASLCLNVYGIFTPVAGSTNTIVSSVPEAKGESFAFRLKDESCGAATSVHVGFDEETPGRAVSDSMLSSSSGTRPTR